MKDNYNAVWVVSKSKIHIYRNPTWLEIIHGESFTPLVKPIRIETETNFISKNNEYEFFIK